jgi:hypothetical protein
MTPSRMKIHVPFVLSLVCMFAACGPTRPPPDLLGAAQNHLNAARAASAKTYAPLELRFAEERLDLARAAMADGDYKKATELADESAVNSELAATKAKLGKLRETVETLKQQNAEIERSLPAADGRGESR